MERVARRIESFLRLQPIRILTLLGAASLLIAAPCDSGSDEAPCTSDTECSVVCAELCLEDPVILAECDDALGTCNCECDTSGAGGSGGVGGSGGSGGMGTGGTGGADPSACGADTECDPAFPTPCGTLCQDICGGFENFDSAGCGDDNRCFCTCLEGICSQ